MKTYDYHPASKMVRGDMFLFNNSFKYVQQQSPRWHVKVPTLTFISFCRLTAPDFLNTPSQSMFVLMTSAASTRNLKQHNEQLVVYTGRQNLDKLSMYNAMAPYRYYCDWLPSFEFWSKCILLSKALCDIYF